MRDRFRWSNDPKDFQLAAVKAQLEGVDMIVQAPTGAGKTALAAGPHVWPSCSRRVTLMVCPLLTLEDELVKTFKTDFGLSAVALNSKNGYVCSNEVVNDILALKHQILLISPEMLQSTTFVDRILRKPGFTQSVVSVFIDEGHCIAHWGADFRKKYGTLGKVRAFLPPRTPFIVVSATITPRVKRAIRDSLLFAQAGRASLWINKGNDRPNVSFVVRALVHPLSTLADIDFVIPSTITSPLDIPITQVFADDVDLGTEVVDYLNNRLRTLLGNPIEVAALDMDINPALLECVRPFNAQLSQEYRAAAMPLFREGHIRVMVCTEAAGMGSNNPRVAVVVQLKMPKKLSNFLQRAGRVARAPGLTGVAYMLVERHCYGVDLVSATPKGKRDPKEVQQYALDHGVNRGGPSEEDAVPTGLQPRFDPDSEDEGLLAFIQSVTCRRQVCQKIFESATEQRPIVPCCDLCDISLLGPARPSPLKNESKPRLPKKTRPNRDLESKLTTWRVMVHSRETPRRTYSAEAILSDSLIDLLVSHDSLSIKLVSVNLQEKWAFWDRYGDELMHVLKDVGIVKAPDSGTPKMSTKRVPRKAKPAPATASKTAPTDAPLAFNPHYHSFSVKTEHEPSMSQVPGSPGMCSIVTFSLPIGTVPPLPTISSPQPPPIDLAAQVPQAPLDPTALPCKHTPIPTSMTSGYTVHHDPYRLVTVLVKSPQLYPSVAAISLTSHQLLPGCPVFGGLPFRGYNTPLTTHMEALFSLLTRSQHLGSSCITISKPPTTVRLGRR
ncbi:P-loop containing nucleoside triphosphate hydrolase protein [Epithele typhae]|uniref:P-loop containing nucleoside triphosphate hydrolase protein n=1 Tax=Epithele typhae TaxID=378194 RepID=UPI002008B360|nr:P-loop containing nucleoside triphosphate hydrolase protein [Epithele typhae]KAH9919751.1 P-loop containing nucleoside triphosphate hydrolase protein [Epithele typhae]